MLAGEKLASTAHFALHYCDLDGPGGLNFRKTAPVKPLFANRAVWLGVMIPKRWAKRAVTRNAIKRQVYTVSSEFESVMPLAAHVVRLRSGFNPPQFVSASSAVLKKAVRNELMQLFRAATQSTRLTAKPGVPQ